MASKKPVNRKSASRKRPAQRAANHRLRVVLAALFVTGFLVLCLVILGHLRQNWHSRNLPQPPVAVVQPAIGDVQLELDSVLWRAGISFDALRVVNREAGVRYEVRAPMLSAHAVTELEQRLAALSPGLRLDARRGEGRMTIHFRQQLLFLVVFTPSQVAVPPPPRPRVAIIMDDLGHDLSSARQLIEMGLPVTFAVLPYTEQASAVAKLGHANGHEVMLHIPMEPRGYPAIDPGPGALLHTMQATEVQRRLGTWLDALPHVVGGNNHMGSRLTEQPAAMAAVLEVLQQRGLFFVDSKTSAASVAVTQAQRLGVPVTLRDVFLDNVRQVPAIARQLQKLAGVARRRGYAVGICHPYPETLAALRQQADVLRQQGIEVVPVSKLLSQNRRQPVSRGG